MPVSADLLKALAEDPKSLEHQLGCMAGLFQIFDRQGLGRRYGSKRVSNAGSGQSQPTSACETPRHDHNQHHLRGNGNSSADPYWMFVEDSSRFEAKNVSEPHHRPAYSDSSEIFTKSFETPTESRTEKSSQSPMYSEESSVIGGLASWDPDHAHDELKQLKVVVPVRAQQQQQQPATDIRDIVRASFERDHIQRAYKEKARHSVDVAAGSHGYLKNLPRSASVDGKDRSMVPDVVAASPQQSRHPVADLPRSSSVGGQRGASRMLSDWKDGLRSSSGSPRLTSKERDALMKQAKNDNRDATRLTVELKEGPRLSVSVDDRRASVDASPRPISRFRDVPVDCPDFNRAADIKEFLRGEKKAGRDGHRFSVDGTRDAPRACIAPRLSVDGRDGRDEAARKAKLVDSSFCRQSSGRKASNVVARLMGLEELSPKETTTTSATPRFAKLEPVLYDQTFLENNHPEFSPPPPPSPPDDYDYAHHTSDHEAFQQRSIHNHFKHQQELLNCQVSTPTPQQETPPYNIKELVITPPEEQAVTPTPPRNDDDDKSARQLVRKSPQGRRSLWHIFEAMQLKGLLQGSSRRKQAEALRVHNLKLTESENEGREQQRRSQSLPPRLNSSSTKDLDIDPIPTVAPVAALEIRKPLNDNDDCEVVIKPIITRSMSPYTRTQSPIAATPPLPRTSTHPCGLKTDNARTYILPDEDITPKMISRAMSKSVGAYLRAVVNEQEMSGDSTQSANGRQSRKERGGAARMTKSSSDVPQSEQRDSSPRCLRGGATTTTTTPTTPRSLQERPARSCSPRGDSSSISPRCPAGNVMENTGRVRRKAFAVKDREESKASLVHMRASATKQEFLKERASGDPDTPRLLRRSSSESKILSKMAESKPETRARSNTPPSMSLLRSKRPVGSKSDTSRSPMKTRPTAAQLGLKPVPKRGAAKPTVLEAAPADSPKASRCAVSEVRATQGGALDQSGDATAREPHVRAESKAREKSVEVDEGVKTPRGVSIKKIDFSEDAQAEVAEQPSPVSVLDNSHFDEELTPSPKAGKTSVVSLQEENLRLEKDRRWSSARLFLDDLVETGAPTAAVPLKVPETAAAAAAAARTPAEVEEPIRHRLRVCLQDADEESRYVKELVYAAELGSGCTSPTELMTHNSYVMDSAIFDQLESKREQALVDSESEKEALDRRVLFDCVNEVLERLLETQLTCARWALQAPRLRKRPMGRQLVKAVFEELDDIPCAASEDVCETVYVILQKDLLNGRGQQWPDSHKELEEVSVAVERLIVKDLIDETVRELWSPASTAVPESSRRQLFA